MCPRKRKVDVEYVFHPKILEIFETGQELD
jgi:hypothetical protein